MTRSKSNLDSGNSYLPQRSMSNLEQSTVRKLLSGGNSASGSRTPPPGRRNVGTPPPHPNLSAAGSKRAPSPLTRSSTPNQNEKKSLIPKFSPQLGRKTPDVERSKTPETLKSSSSGSKTTTTNNTTGTTASSTEQVKSSLIPRVVTPPALRKMFPKKEDKLSNPDRNVVRKQTLNKSATGVATPDYQPPSPTPAKASDQQSSNPKVFTRQMTRSIDEALMEESGEETETLDDTE